MDASRRDPHASITRGRIVTPLAALAGLSLWVGCKEAPPELPPGAVLAGDVAAANRLFSQLKRWEGTKASGWADQRLAQLADCAGQFSWIAAEGQPDALRCEALPDLARWSAGHPLVFALPAAAPGRLVGWIDPGETLRLGAELLNAEEDGIWGLLLPHEQAPGPFVLSDERALVHGRIRAARIAALPELVESGGQGDAMFGLKSELFTNSILDGTWEIAVYVPEGEHMLPEVALAVGVRSEELARAALHAYIDQVEATWKITFTDGIPGIEGCFEQVNMLPGLAPCGAIDDGVITLGWNRQSLDRARSGPPGAAVDGAVVRVSMDRFPEADRLLSLAFAPDAAPPQVPYPWSTLELQLRRDDAGVHLSAEARPR